MADEVLGADLMLRLGIDAAGVAAEMSSKLTAAERAAVASGDRISSKLGQGYDKATVAQLRLVSATERHNRVMMAQEATVGQRANAQAALLTAQSRLNKELSQTERTTVAVAKAEKSRFGGVAAGLAGGFAAGGVMGGIAKLREARDAAVEYQDVISANQSVLGSASTQIDAFITRRAKALNLDKLTAQQLAGSFGGLLKASGLDQGKAVEQALALTERAADVRSLKGGRLEDITGAFSSALVGEMEPVRRYGILLDDASLRQEALRAGLVKTTKDALPPAIKTQAALNLILAKSADAQGDIARTSDSAANRAEAQKRAMNDLKVEIGTGVLPLYGELLTVGSELAPTLNAVAKGLTAVLSNDTARHAGELALAAAALGKINKSVAGFGANVAARVGGYSAITAAATTAAAAEERAAVAGLASGAGGLRGKAAAAVGGLSLGNPVVLGAAGLIGVTALADKQSKDDQSRLVQRALGHRSAVQAELARNDQQLAAAERAQKARVLAAGPGSTSAAYGALASTQEIERMRTRSKNLRAALRDAGEGTDKLSAAQRQGKAEAIQYAAAMDKTTKATELAARRAEFAVDPFAVHPASGRASAAALRIAELRLRAAQEAARTKGTTTSERVSVLSAQQRLDALQGQGGPSSLDPQEALARIRANVREQRGLRRDYRTVAGKGASREALDALKGLESSAPGTVHRIATSASKQYARQFSESLADLSRATDATEALFHNTESRAEKKGRRDARAYRKGWEEALGHPIDKPPVDPIEYFTNLPNSFPVNANGVARRRRMP
jgi:hypothetical protein